MSFISKLVGIWMFRRTVTSTTPLFMQLVFDMAALVFGVIVIALLGAMLLTGILWIAYHQMILADVQPVNAQLVIFGTVLALFAAAGLVTRNYWRNMRRLSNRIVHMQTPATGKLSSIADSFMDGLMTRSPRKYYPSDTFKRAG